MLPTRACRWCGEQIALVRTEKGRVMPLDPEPNDEGNVIVTTDGGKVVAHVTKKGGTPLIGTLFMPHFATCVSYRRRGRRRG